MADNTFNVLDHIKTGRKHPEAQVTVYFDEAAMYELRELEKQAGFELDGEKVNALDAQMNELREQIEATSLTFHLRGIPEDIRDSITESAKSDEHKDDKTYEDSAALEAHVLKIVDAKGAQAEGVNLDLCRQILLGLPASERTVLISKVVELSYKSIVYERVEVNPDF